MKRIISKSLALSATLVLLFTVSAMAQRVITGTVYREGKPAAGVTVEAHKSSETFMTSFDGKYKISADPKTKYLKFTFIDDARKMDIEGKPGDVFDFSFDGALPAQTEEKETGVDTRTLDELVKANDKTFISNYSMEDQFYKQKDYKSAIGPWRLLFNKYPKSIINIYLHGCNMYETLFKNSTNWTEKNSYIDSVMFVYERRIKYFNDKGFVRGRQGTDYLDMKRQNESWTDDELKAIMKKGYGYLDESVKIQGDKAEAPVLVLYMQTATKLFRLGELPKEKVVEIYGICADALDKYLGASPDDEKFKQSKEAVNQIFGVSGAADCEALINLYTAKYDEISKDLDALKKMLRMLDKEDCTESELFTKASEKLYELEPSPEAAFNMGRMFMKMKDFAKGKEYYKQAIEAEKDPELLSKYYFELGAFTFANDQNFQEAAGYLKKSIANNASNANALIMLGDVYAASSKHYSEKDIEQRSLFWLAVDYYAKAKKADPEMAAKANEKIATYSQYFPDKENLFFEGFKIGDTYRIGSWINETTTVRAR